VESRTEAPPKAQPAETRGPSAGGPAEPPKAPRKRPPVWALIVVGILVIVGLFYGIKFLLYATSHETTDDARVDADTVAITSKIAERVDKVLVDTNQAVTKGQILVRLDDVDERTKLASALANRQAQIAQARAAQSNVALTSATQRNPTSPAPAKRWPKRTPIWAARRRWCKPATSPRRISMPIGPRKLKLNLSTARRSTMSRQCRRTWRKRRQSTRRRLLQLMQQTKTSARSAGSSRWRKGSSPNRVRPIKSAHNRRNTSLRKRR
jgi:multidrug resistance efflux pump